MIDSDKYRGQLIIALCEGVPYGLKVAKQYRNQVRTLLGVNIVKEHVHFVEPDAQSPGGYSIFDPLYRCNVDIKPFLRPMSSMTEDEKKEYYDTMTVETQRNYPNSCDFSESTYYSNTHETFDWLNEHHFDFRGLIEHKLAYEAPKGMYE